MDIGLPEVGDEVGLRRLVVQTIRRVRSMDIPEDERRAWIAEIEREFLRARALAR